MVMALATALAALLPQSITAQQDESAAQREESTARSPQTDDREFRGPLPFFFGKLGLSEPQKVKLYQIQESYDEQIARLRKQIEELELQREKSMETLLTPGQKLRLNELREEARLNEEARLKKEQSVREQPETPAGAENNAN
jgi:hypothetical protein